MKNPKSHLELKIVANDLQQIKRLIIWSENLGFFNHEPIQCNESGLYWTFLEIKGGLIETPKKASDIFGDCAVSDLPKTEETESKENLEVKVKKENLVRLYNFAYELAKLDDKKLYQLKEIDLIFNT
jgi:hypothetical protein